MTWFLDAYKSLQQLSGCTDEAVSNARWLLERLSMEGVRRPFISPTPDGEVRLEWEGGRSYLEITCSKAYHYSLLKHGEKESDEERGETFTPVATAINCLESFQ